MCLVRERTRARVWALNSSGEVLPVGPLPLTELAAVGPGPRLTVVDRDGRMTALDLSIGRVTSVHPPSGSGYVLDARSVAGRLALLLNDEGITRLVFFRVD
ncbi:MAG: hypothetical protein ACREMQ_05230 [Longimicrobiales bacterium]